MPLLRRAKKPSKRPMTRLRRYNHIQTPVSYEIQRQRRELREAQQARIAKRREMTANLSGEVDVDKHDHDCFELDALYYEQSLRRFKTTLQRELNNDAFQYLENLYREFYLWKTANRPGPSPLDHLLAVLQSLEGTSKKICQEIMSTVGHVQLWEKYNALNHFIYHLQSCINDLHIALLEEDMMDPLDKGVHSTYSTLEHRHEQRSLRMFDDQRLQLTYNAAGL
ncbi:hypothetical protein AAF712_011639 [Marasmius tenuissimus]|uniref:Uncharacterized protein n=1 Tax=Marasmius tenuissimus TaxID=585030 RepID=A0ABR2ZIT9_9AGAR